MIYDCFTFFNELDLTEIRLNIMDSVADKFVIVEGNKTHTGNDKDFIFEQNKEKFSKFLEKIIYIKVNDFPSLNDSNSDSYGNKWLYENYQRDAIMRGLTDCKPGDIIIISDCDEIPNPKIIKKYKNGICSLLQWTFYYSLNTLNSTYPYSKGAKICRFSDLRNPKQDIGNIEYAQYSKYGMPTYLRFCKGEKIKNGGWHFSYLGDAETIAAKRKSIVEQQFNTNENTTIEKIKESISKGEDILGRGIKFTNIKPKDILPDYIKNNINKYERYINYNNTESFRTWKIKYLSSKIYSKSYENNDKNNRAIYKIAGIKIKVKPKRQAITQQDKDDYIEYVLNKQLDSSDFIDDITEYHEFNEKDTKLISFYLPQFHAIPENDKWFVKGFTEWFNVAKTVPQYTNHWQPHLPIDVGFYNLETMDVMKRQIELAKKYGISGFCFYYYWFNGQKLLEKPIEAFLKDKSIDMPFCLFWDSNHWTKTWNGGKDNEIMYSQKIEENTAKCFMDDFLKYAHDERYIKIDNKPVFIISTPNTFEEEKFKKFINEIRNIAKTEGFKDLYLMSLRGNVSEEEIQKLCLDAMLEFFPCGIDDLVSLKQTKIINKKFNGHVYDVEKFINSKKYLYKSRCKIFKSCFTNWDNTARKCYRKGRIYQSNPQWYKIWLKDIIKWTKENHNENEQFVFINAWNEWAEGAHLEPDQKYGYAFLKATKEALEES